MAFENALPFSLPGFTWSSVVSPEVQEIVTTINAEGLDALARAPMALIGWADRGTRVSPGIGTVKVPIRLPASLAFVPFDPATGARQYNSIDLAAPVVRASPWQLNFAWPMVLNALGNAQIMSLTNGNIETFLGATGLASQIVTSARFHKAQTVATLFWKSMTSAAIGITAEALTVPQPGQPNGLPLFTNGIDSPEHYAHPFRSDSGRFKTLYESYGTFDAMFEDSLVVMTQVPHPTLPNMPMGLQTTDVYGPTWMRSRFFRKAVQTLSLQIASIGVQAVAGATTNPMATSILQQYREDNFIGAAGFAPQRYWLCPALDNHPYFKNADGSNKATMTAGPGGQPADMWVNVSAEDPALCWAELVAPNREFMPISRLYGDGDPLSQSQRRVRLESDLDAGAAAGLPHGIQMFLGV